MSVDYRLRSGDVSSALTLTERLNSILQSIDLRIGGVEEQSASIGEMEAALRAYGTDRINAVLAPVVTAIRAAAGLGALLTTTSATATEIGTGTKEFIIPPTRRDAFAPAAHLSIVADDDAGAAMLARRVGWDPAAGLLSVEVIEATGAGAHASWTISAAAAVENAGQVRTAASGLLTGATLAAQLVEIAEALAARPSSTPTLAALAALALVGDRVVITDAAGAPALAPLGATGKTLISAPDKATARAAIDAAPLVDAQLAGTPTAPTAPVTADSNRIANITAVRAAIANLAGTSPAALDTLAELASALGDDPNFATTILNALAGKQPLDATLTALAGIITAADRLIYATGADTFATTPLSAYARSLLDDADAATARATLEVPFAGVAPNPVLGMGLSADFNQDFVSGWYTVSGDWTNGPLGAAATAYIGTMLIVQRNGQGLRQTQIFSSNDGSVWVRTGSNLSTTPAWSTWRRFITSGGGTIDGSLTTAGLRVSGNASVGSTSYGAIVEPLVPDTSTSAMGVYAAPKFGVSTLSTVAVFYASQTALGSTTITYQYGYRAAAGLVGATSVNAGYVGDLAAAATAWNLYMGGTAQNYLAGPLGIGVPSPDDKLVVAGIAKPYTDNAHSLGTSSRRWSSVYAATGTINTSDAREKTDVIDLPPALELLCSLRPVAYRWKIGGVDVETVEHHIPRPYRVAVMDEVTGEPIIDPNTGEAVTEERTDETIEIEYIEHPRPGRRVHFGLIAQEVQAVAATVGVDFAGYVYDAESDRHGLRYDQFVAPLIKAVQELAAKNRELGARLAALEAGKN